jgi:hypothetical protein
MARLKRMKEKSPIMMRRKSTNRKRIAIMGAAHLVRIRVRRNMERSRTTLSRARRRKSHRVLRHLGFKLALRLS